jgi:hypothetical protein
MQTRTDWHLPSSHFLPPAHDPVTLSTTTGGESGRRRLCRVLGVMHSLATSQAAPPRQSALVLHMAGEQ